MREDKLLGLDLREVFLPSYPESGPHPVDLVFCNVTPIIKICGQEKWLPDYVLFLKTREWLKAVQVALSNYVTNPLKSVVI